MATNKTVKKTIIIDIKGKQAEVSINGVKKSMKDLNVELNNMRQNATGASAATGAASATVLELGRAVSDSNYGIRGMANNLSQLATNFIYTTKQAGTLAGGLKNIGQALMGPLGVILLFQTGIALLERWAMSSEKAAKETEGLEDSLGAAGSNLRILRDTLEKGLLTQEEANEAVRKANEEYDDLNIELDYNNQLTEASKTAIDNKIQSLKHLAKALALQSLLEEKYSKLLPLQAKQMELDTNAKLANARAIDILTSSITERGTFVAMAAAEKATSAQEAGQEAIDALKKEIEELLQLAGDEGLVSEIFKTPKKRKKGGRKTTSDDKKSKPAEIIGEDLFPRLMEMGAEQERAYLDFLSGLGEEAAIIAQEGNMNLLNQEILHQEMMTNELKAGTIERAEAEHELYMMRIELQQMEFEHEEMILAKKLRIQQEYVGYVATIGKALGDIAGENEALAKMALIVEKGAAIAGVVVSASQSIATRTAQHAMIPAFIPPFGIPNPAKALDAAAMAKDITMTKVGAGVSIAAIIAAAIKGGRKTIPGGRRPSTASTGGDGGGREFDFNLVGSTGTNQLASAVSNQFQEPVQAYVVSSQMTSQQELDLQISAGASLGD
tara:strand:+ start:779 stop:2614 length:1836 start_codon:yes stop_codon:yes gene_type:complete